MKPENLLKLIAQYYNQYIYPYLTVEYQGEAFQRFEIPHLIVFGMTLLLTFLTTLSRSKLDDEGKANLREIMAQILIINEIISYLWLYFYEGAELLQIFPLNPINILAWLSALMLLIKGKKLYELVYFHGIASALFALLMPSLGIYGFPHYRFFYAFITPAIIIIAAIYMTLVEEMRPTWKSLLRIFIITNIYMVAVYFINSYIGSNYLYLNHKPPTASILDALPTWPIYLLYMEALGIVTCLILYIPFIIKDWWDNRGLKEAGTERLDDLLP